MSLYIHIWWSPTFFSFLFVLPIHFFTRCVLLWIFMLQLYVLCSEKRKQELSVTCLWETTNKTFYIIMSYVNGKVTTCQKLPSKPMTNVSFKLWIKATRRCVTSYFTLFENKNDLIISMLLDSHMVMVTSLESLQTAGSFLWKQFSWKPMISVLFWKVTVTDLMDFETQRNPCNSFLQKLHYVLTLQKTIVL